LINALQVLHVVNVQCLGGTPVLYWTLNYSGLCLTMSRLLPAFQYVHLLHSISGHILIGDSGLLNFKYNSIHRHFGNRP